MSQTKLSGRRIKNKTISIDHLTEDFVLSEDKLKLMYPTHNHVNKEILDLIRYSGSSSLIDLKDMETIILEVVTARREGRSLGGTIDLKVDKTVYDLLNNEVKEARGNYTTLYEAIRSYGALVESKLDNHFGATGHALLDKMYSDYVASKNGMISLKDRLDNMEANIGGSGSGSGGNININLLRQWSHTHIIQADENNNPILSFTIPYAFNPNSNNIEVFEGPLRMLKGVDYEELDNNTIVFKYDLPVGSNIYIRGISKSAYCEWEQHFRSTENQEYFNLSGSYEQGLRQLEVYESGLLMTIGVDYTEVNSKSIKFLYKLPVNSIVTIVKRR